MPRHGSVSTSIGELLLVADEGADGDALIGLYFPQHKYPPNPEEIGENLGLDPDDPVLSRTGREIREYLAGERREFDVPLSPRGDEFSQRVWGLLLEIPYGETRTYGWIADRLGNRALAQRVGQSVGHNPISILIPCHRVLGADGSLTGFAGGLERKRALLALEEPPASEAGRLF